LSYPTSPHEAVDDAVAVDVVEEARELVVDVEVRELVVVVVVVVVFLLVVVVLVRR
jgi:hypothetical protein